MSTNLKLKGKIHKRKLFYIAADMCIREMYAAKHTESKIMRQGNNLSNRNNANVDSKK